MGLYGLKGSYAGYDKNNKEREALDYYATPPEEIKNFLTKFYNKTEELEHKTILEPSCGGGHMVLGLSEFYKNSNIIATDIKNRDKIDKEFNDNVKFFSGADYDFLSTNYPIKEADIVMMNPPFKIGEAFVLHALEITKEYLFVFEKTKFVESINRYNNLFKNFPPSYIYQYIDRVTCGKNGIFSKESGVEAYAWFVWDLKNYDKKTYFDWIWSNKKNKIK